MASTLISASHMDKAGYTVHIGGGISKNHKRGAYLATTITINDLHQYMGHVAHKLLNHLIDSGLTEGVTIDNSEAIAFCETCVKAKATRKPFPKIGYTQAKKYGERIHLDLWGPAIIQDMKA
ncbi:hypothetical protein SERLA73DRAFT_69979 [Serpula lacrymans var. lacrymans S7.3]|uniref:Uncharacterized protein n=1 Tax=Serpula lacrymans var. lacrymans (strain S7.3) TaxID=936435 RepID=F8PLJ5_SERL3|nr:hypothetical protein SERLA73DRAFT_69979 [Serpula lacrymans var. lacrymans S7.3]